MVKVVTKVVTKKPRLDLTDEVKRRVAVNSLTELLTSGFSDEQARIELGLSVDDYDALKGILYDRETASLKSKTNEMIFIDYTQSQMTVLKEVDLLLEKLDDSKMHAAAVGALRLSSDVKHRILTVGQDLGVLSKRAPTQRHLILTGSIDDMRAAVAREVRDLEDLMRSAGSGDLKTIDVGPVHRELPAAVLAPSTTGKRTSHHGRKVIKEGPKTLS